MGTRATVGIKFLAFAVVVALLAVCGGDVVHAAARTHAMSAGPMECGVRFCDEQSRCSARGVALEALPLAALPLPAALIVALAPVRSPDAIQPPVAPEHRVLTLAPRSPPLV